MGTILSWSMGAGRAKQNPRDLPVIQCAQLDWVAHASAVEALSRAGGTAGAIALAAAFAALSARRESPRDVPFRLEDPTRDCCIELVIRSCDHPPLAYPS